MSVTEDIIYKHFTTILLIFLCSIKLYSQRKNKGTDLRYFWVTLICCSLLVIQDILESYSSLEPQLRFWRVLLSVIGYVVRPVAAVGLLLVVLPPKRRTWIIWLPALINAVINLTAFFSPAAFYFNDDYHFVRGPLGYVVFVVSFLYLILLLMVILSRFYEGNKAERLLLVFCVLGVMGASVVDALMGGRHLNEAIMIGCIFILFYLRSHDNYLDPLTSLRNRFAYYDDCENISRKISAVASIDMNGLKELNDTQGHAAGDAALTKIGKFLNEVTTRQTIAYRIGGDEFAILFIDQTMEDVENIIHQINEKVSGAGYSISVGYAMTSPDQNLNDALLKSDQNMYKEKAEYYRNSGKDRRRSDRRISD